MSQESQDLDMMYYQLVLSMQASAMQHLGKVMSPVSGKIERNLEAARYSIDMLEMLKHKTVGNLSDDESKLLEHILYQLRLNYIDEAKKGETPDQTETPTGEPASETAESNSGETGEETSPGENGESNKAESEGPK